MFQCDCCGLCCMNVDKTEVVAGLDRGDGVCKFFNSSTKLCEIYNSRPVICNVDKCYELIYKHTMSKEEYYDLNYKACKILKSNNNLEG